MTDLLERLSELITDYEEGRWRQYDAVLSSMKDSRDLIEALMYEHAEGAECLERGRLSTDFQNAHDRVESLISPSETVAMTMIRGYIYRAVMRIAHRYNWHYAPPIYHENDIQLWCKWCGFRQTIHKGAPMVPGGPLSTGESDD